MKTPLGYNIATCPQCVYVCNETEPPSVLTRPRVAGKSRLEVLFWDNVMKRRLFLRNVELWRPVVGYEGLYLVSNWGRVRSVERREWVATPTGGRLHFYRDKIRKLKLDKTRHLSIPLHKNKKSKFKFVHRLVLEAFIGPCQKGMECCHNDGNPENNQLWNLRWDTPENNKLDMIRHGTTGHGERNSMSKLTGRQVLQIRSRFNRGEKDYSKIARIFNICSSNVRFIVARVTWRNI